jgi:type VI secretion system ImpC/EvpB family protein/type VI secretion system ImpB/VipA family protein
VVMRKEKTKMANKYNFGSVNLGSNPSDQRQPIDPDTPFRMLVIGDFSGRGNRGQLRANDDLPRRRIWKIDRDNFDEVMSRLDVCLSNTIVDNHDESLSVRFGELDDFEPDQLFESVALFGQLRILRQQLLNDSTFAAAAAEVRSWVAADLPSVHSSATTTPEISLNDLLANTEQQQDQQPTSAAITSRWDAMINSIVEPLITAGPDPDLEVLVECVDAAISESMRALLHHSDFQHLESVWRGLFLMVRRLETGSDLQIHLLDVSSAEVAQDLQAQEVSDSGLYRLIVEQSVGSAGGVPWSAMIGCEVYSANEVDIHTLRQFGKIAAAAGAPFISGAVGGIVGCSDPATMRDSDEWLAAQTKNNQRWQSLLKMQEAAFIQLLWPRFRIRLPYGNAARRIEAFDFEELSNASGAADYLWCNPAFAAGVVLGQAFTESGAGMQPGEIDSVDDLPICFERDGDGEEVALPSGELWVTDRTADRIRQCGITPLLSVKSQATVRVGRFCGVNGEPLQGRWSGMPS